MYSLVHASKSTESRTGAIFQRRQMESQIGDRFGLEDAEERIEQPGGRSRLTSAVGKDARLEARLPRHRDRIFRIGMK